MISPKTSQVTGLAVSVIVLVAVYFITSSLFAYVLDFWHIGEVLGPVAGIGLGGLAAFEMYTLQQREVPLYWVGVVLFLGKPTGWICENGIHWIFPLCSLQNVPGEDKKYIVMMPQEKISAQDGALIFFGVSDEPMKRNRVQYSVIDPLLYIATDNPEDSLKEAYLEQARLFFSQAASPIGVKDEKTVFSDYVMLPPEDDPDPTGSRDDFRERLGSMTYLDTGVPDASGKKSRPCLFSKESVATIMANAGEFRENAAKWGLGRIMAFTPNVRANPATEEAAAKKQQEKEAAESLRIEAENVIRLAKKMIDDDGVSPDLAGTLIAAIGGQNVNVDNKTFTISGLPEVIRLLGEKAIESLKDKK